MADALTTSVDDLETECARLINEDKLMARIDSQQKLLKSKETDQRTGKRERACIAYMENTCRFSISIPPPSFKPDFIVIATYLFYSKTPKQVFFFLTYINIF